MHVDPYLVAVMVVTLLRFWPCWLSPVTAVWFCLEAGRQAVDDYCPADVGISMPALAGWV